MAFNPVYWVLCYLLVTPEGRSHTTVGKESKVSSEISAPIAVVFIKRLEWQLLLSLLVSSFGRLEGPCHACRDFGN